MVALDLSHSGNSIAHSRHRFLSSSHTAPAGESPRFPSHNQRYTRPRRDGAVVRYLHTVYQQLQIYRIRRQMAEREELITENAADMIAVVDSDGRRLYNSPSYQKILGYTPEELQNTSSLDQVHPDDRPQVQEAA